MPDDLIPDDDDLIAYLDGELDDGAARQVEDRLALDPAARAKATALKKSYDLLDYLPKPEPSADFASRTLTRIEPAVVPARPVSPSAPAIGSLTTAYPGSAFSASAMPSPARALWPWLLGWTVAAVLALLGGFGLHAGLARFVDVAPKDADDLALSDLRVIETLPLFLGVDDLDFLKALDDPELFAVDPSAPPPAARTEVVKPDGNRDRLIALFKSYPPARQQQLRSLDQQFHDLPPVDRDHLGRVLDGYAVWLDRLPDAERREVLNASTPTARLEVVQYVRERAWRESLSAKARQDLKNVSDEKEKLAAVARLKGIERTRRDEWGLARRQWDVLGDPNRKPWPFGDADLAKQVDDFLRVTLKVDLTVKFEPKDLPAGCRLTAEELRELRFRHEAAVREGNWFLYGLQVYRSAAAHPYLPEHFGKTPIIDVSQVPKTLTKDLRLNQFDKRSSRGKWPDFALELAEAANKAKVTLHEPLGPSRPGEYPKPIETFLNGPFDKLLTTNERDALKRAEGKWPEHSRLMIALARKHDEPVPGVTLPGKPSQWAKYYALTTTFADRLP